MKRIQEQKQKKIANERIEILFDKASHSDRSKRYIEMARKIAMKLNIKLTKEQKRKFCKHCYTYLNHSNSTTRTHNKKLIIFCKECKKYTRIPLLKKPSKK